MNTLDPDTVPGPLKQIALSTHNVQKLATFYRDQVGLTHLFDAGPNLSFFDLGGVRLMITAPSSQELDHPPSLIYFDVANIETVHRALVERGVTEERPPALATKMPEYELWNSFLRDCDNNLFALMSEKPNTTKP